MINTSVTELTSAGWGVEPLDHPDTSSSKVALMVTFA
jgi:hypothetical protein